MEALLTVLEGWEPVALLRASTWLYPAVNALHILGIALLVGGILPLDLRRLGAWSGVPVAHLERVLTATAAAGLCLAVLSGTLLFAVGASDYAALGVFQAKMALVALGTATALWARRRFAAERVPAWAALLSLGVWLAALGAGRAIGYLL